MNTLSGNQFCGRAFATGLCRTVKRQLEHMPPPEDSVPLPLRLVDPDAPAKDKQRRRTNDQAADTVGSLLFRLVLDHLASKGYTPRCLTRVHRAWNSEFFETCTSYWGSSWEHLTLNQQKEHLQWFLFARWEPKGTGLAMLPAMHWRWRGDSFLMADEVAELCRDVMVSYASQRALLHRPLPSSS